MKPYIEKSKNEQNQDEYAIHGLTFRQISIVLRSIELRSEIIEKDAELFEKTEVAVDFNELSDNTQNEITNHLLETSDLSDNLIKSFEKAHND